MREHHDRCPTCKDLKHESESDLREFYGTFEDVDLLEIRTSFEIDVAHHHQCQLSNRSEEAVVFLRRRIDAISLVMRNRAAGGGRDEVLIALLDIVGDDQLREAYRVAGVDISKAAEGTRKVFLDAVSEFERVGS